MAELVGDFGEFGFDSDDSGAGDAPALSARELRLRKAFGISKANFPNEVQILTHDWHLDPVQLERTTALLNQTPEYPLPSLYLLGRYPEALALAQQLLTTTPTSSAASARERESLDILMRCALKLKQPDLGLREYDERAERYVKGNPGLAVTAGELWLLKGDVRRAIDIAFYIHSVRGPPSPVLHLLASAFDAYSPATPSTTATASGIRNRMAGKFRLDADTLQQACSDVGLEAAKTQELVEYWMKGRDLADEEPGRKSVREL